MHRHFLPYNVVGTLLLIVFFISPSFAFALDTTDGLVGLWRFDETTGISSTDSRSSIQAVFSGLPIWGTGKIGGGVSFDGMTVRAVATSSLLSNLSKMTISVWVKPNSLGGSNGISNERILTKSSLTAKRFGFHINPEGGVGFLFGFSGSVGSWKTAPNTVSLNTWHHIVVTYDSSSLINVPIIYIDGVVQNVTEFIKPVGVPVTDNSILFIGDNPNADGSISTKAYNGTLDQLRIYNRMLSSTEVQNIYQTENPSDGMVLHFKFNEGKGKTTYDAVNSIPAQFVNMPTWVAGKLGTALSFDGKTNHLEVGQVTYANLNTFTLSSWINLHALGGGDGRNNSRISLSARSTMLL